MPWAIDRNRSWGQRLQAVLPVLLLGTLALVTYWLVRNSPIMSTESAPAQPSTKPNAYFRNFHLVSFDAQGRWIAQISGVKASHRDVTEMYEIESPQVLRRDQKTDTLTQVSARQGQVNEQGSLIRLHGQAVIRRESNKATAGAPSRPLEISSETLLLDDERQMIEAPQTVLITQGLNRFSADHMVAMQPEGKLQLTGRVHGTLMPRTTQDKK